MEMMGRMGSECGGLEVEDCLKNGWDFWGGTGGGRCRSTLSALPFYIYPPILH